jgi:hypothetical protein
MPEFSGPTDLTFNRGPIRDPEAFARNASAASWLYLCGDEFAAMEQGMSYESVQDALPESVNIVSDPPREMDMALARQHVAALDTLGGSGRCAVHPVGGAARVGGPGPGRALRGLT